jgi:hypothetical protein
VQAADGGGGEIGGADNWVDGISGRLEPDQRHIDPVRRDTAAGGHADDDLSAVYLTT